MTNFNRISSIDIMRGLTLFLMLFVNDLNMKYVPSLLGHMPASFDGMGLADWVFPGFLFIMGMAIPFSFSKRLSAGDDFRDISQHIIKRFLSLIVIGVLMLNTGRVNAELTGISKNLWALLMYIAVFFAWNDYPKKENNFFTVMGLRLLGLTILVALIFKFRSGTNENSGSLITSWWGILGLIGWGYLVSAFTFVLMRDSILKTAFIIIIFLALNIVASSNLFTLPPLVDTLFGVIIQGNVPLIVLTGLLAGVVLKKLTITEYKKTIKIFAGSGILFIAAGFLLRHWFIISKIQATPSWALICCGISLIVFILLYWITDVKQITRWVGFVRPAGEHSLTTYLAPDILYYLIWSTTLPILIYKQSENPLIEIAGSLLWSLIMVWLTALLVRLNIKLKL